MVELIHESLSSGGLELLFANQRHLRVSLAGDGSATIETLLATLVNNHLKERPELFVSGHTVYVEACPRIRSSEPGLADPGSSS